MGPAQTFESVSRRPPDVEDYVDMLRRYRSWIVGPTFAGLVISTVIAFLWPDTYISTAVMRITPQQVPERLVPAVVSSQMADRLMQMQTEILSRGSLSEIIQKPALDLYKRERNRVPLEDIVQEMKNKYIKIAPLADPNGGGRRFASAFAISFMYPDRYKAQAVVRELVTKFAEQNVTVQRQQASLTTTFLNDELKGAQEKMEKLDDEIVQFKKANQGRLPEKAQANAQARQMYEIRLMDIGQQIYRAQQDKILFDGELTDLKNRENAAAVTLMETIGGGNSGPTLVQNQRLVQLSATISQMRAALAAKKERFGAGHPDVAEDEAAIQLLEGER